VLQTPVKMEEHVTLFLVVVSLVLALLIILDHFVKPQYSLVLQLAHVVELVLLKMFVLILQIIIVSSQIVQVNFFLKKILIFN